MKKTQKFSCLLLAALAITATPALAENPAIQTLHEEVAVAGASLVHTKLSIGDLTIEGTDGNTVQIELTLDCNRVDPAVCKKRANKVRLAPQMRKGELKIKLKNTTKTRMRGIKARMTVRIPQHLPIEVDINNGDLYVGGMHSHINVNSGGGDVDVNAERARTNEVEVDVGFGSADLWLGEERIKGTGWPKSLEWKGTGDASIEVDVVGSGDVAVRLE